MNLCMRPAVYVSKSNARAFRGRSKFRCNEQTGIFWRIDTETPSAPCTLTSPFTIHRERRVYKGDVHAKQPVYKYTNVMVRRVHTLTQVNEERRVRDRPWQLDDPWKAFSTTDILAIGHDIVYRYTRCRDHVGGHVYNLPTFLWLVSRVILTLANQPSSQPVGRSSPPPLAVYHDENQERGCSTF